MILKHESLLNCYRLFLKEEGFNYSELANGEIDLELVKRSFSEFIELIAKNGGNRLNKTTPIECHPYIDAFPVDYQKSKLIIGTFPPFSYVGSLLKKQSKQVGDIGTPTIDFFHGNELSLWDFAGVQGAKNKSSSVGDVLEYLDRNDTTITDIISFCQRDKYNSNDTSLHNIGLNFELTRKLIQPSAINTLIFTNSSANGAEGLKLLLTRGKKGEVNCTNRDAFSLFLRSCQIEKIKIEIAKLSEDWVEVSASNVKSINGSSNNQLELRLRLNEEFEYRVFTPPSPSGSARRGLPRNAVFKKLKKNRKDWEVDQYRKDVWTSLVRNGHIDQLVKELNG